MGHCLGSSMACCSSCCGKKAAAAPDPSDNQGGNDAEGPSNTAENAMVTGTVPDPTPDSVVPVIEVPVEEFKEITENFGEDSFLGQGDSGKVYFGVLRSGRGAAIRTLHWEESEEEFLAEVLIASAVQHGNLMRLIAYGTNGTTHVLAYEFPSNFKTLYDVLHSNEATYEEVTWVQRVKIAVDIARGIEHLHDTVETRPRINFHREVRSTSILVSPGNSSAMIADFDQTNEDIEMVVDRTGSARFVRAFSCQAPESAKQTKESEVYNFGVIVLELVTGFDPMEVRSRGQRLIDFAKSILTKSDYDECVDPRMPRGYPRNTMASFIDISTWCLQEDPGIRPPIGHVRISLEQLLDDDQQAGPSSDPNLDPNLFGSGAEHSTNPPASA